MPPRSRNPSPPILMPERKSTTNMPPGFPSLCVFFVLHTTAQPGPVIVFFRATRRDVSFLFWGISVLLPSQKALIDAICESVCLCVTGSSNLSHPSDVVTLNSCWTEMPWTMKHRRDSTTRGEFDDLGGVTLAGERLQRRRRRRGRSGRL